MIKWAVSTLAALGFTILMAGANLAHLTAQAKGNSVPILGFEISHRAFMTLGALCIDGVIIVAPIYIEELARKRMWSRLVVAFAAWLICSAVSLNSVHAWLSAAEVEAADASAKDQKRSETLKNNIAYERRRLETIRKDLQKGPDNETRRVLRNQEKEAQTAIDNYQKQDWESATASMQPALDSNQAWFLAGGMWFLSVGTWFAFRPSHLIPPFGWDGGMRNGMSWDLQQNWDEKTLSSQYVPPSQNEMDSIPRIPPPTKPSQPKDGMRNGRPDPLPPGVLDARPKLAQMSGKPQRLPEDEAISMAIAMRSREKPASWGEIARATGWPVSSINRKYSMAIKA